MQVTKCAAAVFPLAGVYTGREQQGGKGGEGLRATSPSASIPSATGHLTTTIFIIKQINLL